MFLYIAACFSRNFPLYTFAQLKKLTITTACSARVVIALDSLKISPMTRVWIRLSGYPILSLSVNPDIRSIYPDNIRISKNLSGLSGYPDICKTNLGQIYNSDQSYDYACRSFPFLEIAVP